MGKQCTSQSHFNLSYKDTRHRSRRQLRKEPEAADRPLATPVTSWVREALVGKGWLHAMPLAKEKRALRGPCLEVRRLSLQQVLL